jgi:hypothetical protein
MDHTTEAMMRRAFQENIPNHQYFNEVSQRDEDFQRGYWDNKIRNLLSRYEMMEKELAVYGLSLHLKTTERDETMVM